FVNGIAVPVQQLKSIGEQLVDIHGQHFHQSLARKPVQRDLLDHFGGLLEHRDLVKKEFMRWRTLTERWRQLVDADIDRVTRLDLLTFQLQELRALELTDGEAKQLGAERQRLANSGRLAEGATSALSALSDSEGGNASSLVAAAHRAVDALIDFDDRLRPVSELLESAGIQIGEAAGELRRYGESIDADPARRDFVEERLDAITRISRKHRVEPDELLALLEHLATEVDELENAEERGRKLEQEVAAAKADYMDAAETLSVMRHDAAGALGGAVTDAMHGLGMPGGDFEVCLKRLGDDNARQHGFDDIEFLITANPGQPKMPLSKVASGGELSRMSLAIQVIASDGSAIPTMVFDEVDSGVGGGIAEMVGRRLAELGIRRQVFSVTHLPQVASLANHHFRVAKVTDGKSTRTSVRALAEDERIEELARMLGGVEITQKTLDHAAEMLSGAPGKSA
ncbi:MAG: DNA repair protein RecN, partial [Woeseiaceae bacterium]